MLPILQIGPLASKLPAGLAAGHLDRAVVAERYASPP
jgi:hypothetical protein